MKIFTADQMKRADQFTIDSESILSVDLMERASNQVFYWLKKTFKSETHFDVICGPGNNGGDGFAVARMLLEAKFSVKVWCLELGNPSMDNQINRKRLEAINITTLDSDNFSMIQIKGVIIDAGFGSGLTRPLSGWVGALFQHLSKESVPKVSIDIASGLFTENNDDHHGIIFQPDHTLTFELEKLAFQFPENQKYLGTLTVLPIGLNSTFISNEFTSCFAVSEFAIKLMHQKGNSVAYKNTFGHALLVTGSTGKMGASVLCAKACLRSGAGLVTVHLPKKGDAILQISVPEAMTISDSSADWVTDVLDITGYQSVGIGPGLGQNKEVFIVLKNILEQSKKALIIDADAINIISSQKELLELIPPGSILTPHLGEWKRMVGEWHGAFDRLQKAKAFCHTHNVFVILKGSKSSIVCPDGEVYFNSTGNSSMATAGSGDVLTGILTGLLAQGYPSKQAAIMGAYMHGLAGDLALKNGSRESVIASDISAHLGKAFQSIY